MPSHWVHVIIGSGICGFFSREIDRFIDFSDKASKEIENDNCNSNSASTVTWNGYDLF